MILCRINKESREYVVILFTFVTRIALLIDVFLHFGQMVHFRRHRLSNSIDKNLVNRMAHEIRTREQHHLTSGHRHCKGTN